MSLDNFCLHLRLFNGSTRHGGVRRTSQISQALSSFYRSNYFHLDLYEKKPLSFRQILYVARNLGWIALLTLRSPLCVRQSLNALILSYHIYSCLKIRNITPDKVVFACETCYPGPSLAISFYLQFCNYTTVVFPHNIECLVSGSTGRFRSNLFLNMNSYQRNFSLSSFYPIL